MNIYMYTYMCIVLYTNNSLMSPKSTRPQISEIPLQLSALLFPPGWFNSKNWREGKLGEVWKNHTTNNDNNNNNNKAQSTQHKAQSTKHKAQRQWTSNSFTSFLCLDIRDAFFEIYLTPHEPVNKITFGKIKVILGPADEPCDALYTG